MTAVLPNSVRYGKVTWSAVSAVADTASDPDALPDPIPVTGSVTFTPSATVLLSLDDEPVTIMAKEVTYNLSADGVLKDAHGNVGINLLATDAPDITPTDWTWKVTYRLNDNTSRGSFSFELPAGTTVDLTRVAPVSSSGGVPIIRGPKGDPGDAVTGTDADTPSTVVRRDSGGGFAARYLYGLVWPTVGSNASNKEYTDSRIWKSTQPRSAKLTVYEGTPPTVTLSEANAPSAIPSPDYIGYANANDPRLIVRGTKLHWGMEDANALTVSTVVPANGTSFQAYTIGTFTDAPIVEFSVRCIGSPYRVLVDGHPLTEDFQVQPSGGAFRQIIVDFDGVRKFRRVEIEGDQLNVLAVIVSLTDTALGLPVTGMRGVILGDSYVEGAFADYRRTAWPFTFGRLCGWDETIAAGSGATGYFNSGAAETNRANYRARFDAVVTVHNPDVVVISGGRNDLGGYSAAQIGAKAGELLAHARAQLPRAQLVITSLVPAVLSDIAYFSAASTAIEQEALAAGAIYLDVNNDHPYVGGREATLTNADGVHPTQLGHDALAHALFQRYVAQVL